MELVKEKVSVEHQVTIGKLVYSASSVELIVLQAYLAYAVNTPEPHQFLGSKRGGSDEVITIYWKEDDIFIVDFLEQESQEITRQQMVELSEAIQIYSGDNNYLPYYLFNCHYWQDNDFELYWRRTSSGVVTQVYQDNKEASDIEFGLWLDDSGCCWGVKGKYSGEEGDITDAYFFDEDCAKNII